MAVVFILLFGNIPTNFVEQDTYVKKKVINNQIRIHVMTKIQWSIKEKKKPL